MLVLTEGATSAWMTQQARNLLMDLDGKAEMMPVIGSPGLASTEVVYGVTDPDVTASLAAAWRCDVRRPPRDPSKWA